MKNAPTARAARSKLTPTPAKNGVGATASKTFEPLAAGKAAGREGAAKPDWSSGGRPRSKSNNVVDPDTAPCKTHTLE